MKKFSNITNQKVGQEPKIEVKLNEEDLFKVKILNLMDQLLTIRTYGPVDKHQRAGLIKIAGKEMFLEALLGLFSDKTLKEQAKLLESLKSEVRDWEMIDVKINDVNTKISESKEKKESDSDIGKYGTYMRYKRVSEYESDKNLEKRILYYLRNFEFDEKKLIRKISNDFNLVEKTAEQKIKEIRDKFPYLKKAGRVLRKFDNIPRYKAPGIDVVIQGK